ncbi:MAG: replication initiator, partial [Micromonosporaceae bacterium]
MTLSTLAPTPETDPTASGAGASTDTQHIRWPSDRLLRKAVTTTETAIDRGSRDDYWRWLDHVTPAAGCTRPIRLRGDYAIADINKTTGEITTRTTDDLPDKVIYTACGNRRASVCPGCAETYRADTYQLVLAGLNGGKGIPTTVVQHPCAFPTFTAPSFGLVHSTRRSRNGRNRVCRPGRTPKMCPHEVDLRCRQTHHQGERILGKPLCIDCYDHHHQVVWNVMAGELWRRTTDKAKTLLAAWADEHDVRLRLSFAKVAEMQARGVAHFHALIRIDGADPGNPADVIPPDPAVAVDFDLLQQIITEAVGSTRFRTPPHPDQPDGWLIEWGREFLVLPVREQLDGQITDTKVAGYLAKYATKATEATGHTSTRITGDTIDHHTADLGHVARLIAAC